MADTLGFTGSFLGGRGLNGHISCKKSELSVTLQLGKKKTHPHFILWRELSFSFWPFFSDPHVVEYFFCRSGKKTTHDIKYLFD